ARSSSRITHSSSSGRRSSFWSTRCARGPAARCLQCSLHPELIDEQVLYRKIAACGDAWSDAAFATGRSLEPNGPPATESAAGADIPWMQFGVAFAQSPPPE